LMFDLFIKYVIISLVFELKNFSVVVLLAKFSPKIYLCLFVRTQGSVPLPVASTLPMAHTSAQSRRVLVSQVAAVPQ